MSIDPEHIFSINDPKVFEQVYKLYSRKLFKICAYYTGNHQEALEMVQEIFESLWQRRKELRFSSSIEHYLVRAAKFKAFKYIRDQVEIDKNTCSVTEEICMAACTEDTVYYNELTDRVGMLIDTLPCQCRKVFKMSREEGLSNKEIASALLISEKAVEYHISKALSVLRKSLEEYK